MKFFFGLSVNVHYFKVAENIYKVASWADKGGEKGGIESYCDTDKCVVQ